MILVYCILVPILGMLALLSMPMVKALLSTQAEPHEQGTVQVGTEIRETVRYVRAVNKMSAMGILVAKMVRSRAHFRLGNRPQSSSFRVRALRMFRVHVSELRLGSVLSNAP